jgi:hypothetical protein
MIRAKTGLLFSAEGLSASERRLQDGKWISFLSSILTHVVA